MVSSMVRMWKPSTSASVQRMILLQRRAFMSKAPMDLLALLFTCTPQPSTLIRSVMISLFEDLVVIGFQAVQKSCPEWASPPGSWGPGPA